MMDDPAARAVLDEVIEEWTAGGVLGELRALVGTVWRTNLDRLEPRLGDDAVTVGIQSSRNLCNLAVRRLRPLDEVHARDVKTLEVGYRGRVLHTSKIEAGVGAVDWSDTSDIRHRAAERNTLAYLPVVGTLDEAFGPLPGQSGDPAALQYLHLAWQGLPDGRTRAWLGFPRLGEEPWFALAPIEEDDGGSGGARIARTDPTGPAPDFDRLGEPELDLVRRVEDDGRRRA